MSYLATFLVGLFFGAVIYRLHLRRELRRPLAALQGPLSSSRTRSIAALIEVSI